MPSQRFHGGFMVLCLFLGSRLALALDPNQSTLQQTPGNFPNPNPANPGNPAGSLQFPDNNSPIPNQFVTALPAQSGSGLPTIGSTTRKFYTITADLRETYDDNVNTSGNGHKISSLETSLTPSLLVDLPTVNGGFTARLTFGLTYYTHGGGENSGNDSAPSLEYTAELNAQYQHAFSDRFNLLVGEDFRYFTEPSLFQSTGTVFRSGPYVTNIITGSLSSQWTPLFSTTTTFANTIVQYQDSDESFQNNIENTGSESFNFAILPKITASAGVIVDEIAYSEMARGYSNYTLFVGGQWQLLPSLSADVRGGGSYTESDGASASITPYAAADLYWTLGQRSSLSFSYSHEIVPNDQIGTDGEIADRFSASFSYAITPSITAHLQGIFTQADITSSLITSSNIPSYNETDYGVDVGASYQYNNYLTLELGVNESGVTSGLQDRSYTRDEGYLGVRGTY